MPGLLSQYLGYGTDAAKPTPPDVLENVLALYWAQDTETLYWWNWDGDPDPLWTAIGGVSDAPADDGLYVRQNNAWYAIPVPLADAPSDGTVYGRKDGAWIEVVGGSGISDAPSDGSIYARKDGAWYEITIPAAGIADAPSDGTAYQRKDGDWVAAPVLVSLTQAEYDALSPPDADTYYFITD